VVTFRVPRTATKQQVARAVGLRYGAVARDVRLVPGRPKRRRRGMTVGATPAWKKAYVVVDDVQAITSGP
jgi:ribosomal protein L23